MSRVGPITTQPEPRVLIAVPSFDVGTRQTITATNRQQTPSGAQNPDNPQRVPSPDQEAIPDAAPAEQTVPPPAQRDVPQPAPPFDLVVPGCSPGLECLAVVEHVLIKLDNSAPDLSSGGYKAKNKFRILNPLSQQIFWAFEEPESSLNDDLLFQITDNNHQEVMRAVQGDSRCKGGYLCYAEPLPCLSDFPAVLYDKTGQMMGYTRHMDCSMSFLGVLDHEDTLRYAIIDPPCLSFGAPQDFHYPIQPVHHGGLYYNNLMLFVRNPISMFSPDAESVGVRFPLHLPAQHKALLMGAALHAFTDHGHFKKMKNKTKKVFLGTGLTGSVEITVAGCY